MLTLSTFVKVRNTGHHHGRGVATVGVDCACDRRLLLPADRDWQLDDGARRRHPHLSGVCVLAVDRPPRVYANLQVFYAAHGSDVYLAAVRLFVARPRARRRCSA